jgi:hypothetical protein
VPVQKIGDWIATSGNLRALARQAERLKVLQQLLIEATPPALAAASRVASLKSGTLLVMADNAAVAAKLRQLAPRLLLQVRRQASEVTGIRVEVQVNASEIEVGQKVTKHSLPPDAIQEIAGLAGKLPPSPLRTALGRLAARQRSKPGGRED